MTLVEPDSIFVAAVKGQFEGHQLRRGIGRRQMLISVIGGAATLGCDTETLAGRGDLDSAVEIAPLAVGVRAQHRIGDKKGVRQPVEVLDIRQDDGTVFDREVTNEGLEGHLAGGGDLLQKVEVDLHVWLL